MLKKRIIGVITVVDGQAVQSIAFKRYLPIGKPEIVAKNLDRWGADEILIQCIDRSRGSIGPDFEIINRISNSGISTPIIYGGGILSLTEAEDVIKRGADRICVDSLLHRFPKVVRQISDRIGSQGLIAAVPLSVEKGRTQWLDYLEGKSVELDNNILNVVKEGGVSETLIIDWQNEGTSKGFNNKMIGNLGAFPVPLVLFGGIRKVDQIRELLSLPNVAAIAIGNSLNYKESAVFEIKKHLQDLSIRNS